MGFQVWFGFLQEFQRTSSQSSVLYIEGRGRGRKRGFIRNLTAPSGAKRFTI